MIRIDEIYYNTFLARLQGPATTGLHWFEPFGTTAFKNICDQPPVDYFQAKRRIFFWDQEPITRGRFSQVFDQFMHKFKRPEYDTGVELTLVTSERDSDEVAWACDTYNLRSKYYFFHGWAALDWFRGYNRSFLMQPYDQRAITRTFIMPNRIIAGERHHRLIMLYHIFRMNMSNNHISCPAICPAENITVHAACNELAAKYPDIQEVFSNTCFPKQFVGEANAPMHSYQLSLFSESAESLLYLVTETVATGRRCHLTEKTFKPIALKMPFILVSTAHSLEYLRSYGFRTFDALWSEAYDLIEDDEDRYSAIADVLRELDQLTLQEKQRLFDSAAEICEHNYQHFYSGGFEAILWTELCTMLQEL
jgi:hypothetical protein